MTSKKLKKMTLGALASCLALAAAPVVTNARGVSPFTYSGTSGPIVYTAFNIQTRLQNLTGFTTNGSAITPTLVTGGLPKFSPNGSKAVWMEGSGPWYLKMGSSSGGNVVTIATGSSQPSPQYPSFSPDGSNITFAYDGDIHVVTAAEGQTISASTRVLDNTGMNNSNYPQYISATKIAYVGTQGNDCGPGYFGIFVKDLAVAGGGTKLSNTCNDSSGPTARKLAYRFDVSPDGQFVVYRGNQTPNEFIAIAKTDDTGSQITVFSTTSGSVLQGGPVFSPDGTKVAFYKGGTPSSIEVATFNGTTAGTPASLTLPAGLTNVPTDFTWVSTESAITSGASSTTPSASTPTTAPTTTVPAPATPSYANAIPGVTVTDAKIYAQAPTKVAGDSAITVLTTAQNNTMDVVSKTPSVCLPNDDDLVFLDEGRCIADVVNAKTRKVLRTLKTTVVTDDIADLKVGNEVAILTPLYFNAGTATFKARSLTRLNSLKSQILTAGSVLVAGHSGNTMGNTPENIALSKQRADATVRALKARGSQGPFGIAAVGALDPATTVQTQSAQDKNRRVVIVLVP